MATTAASYLCNRRSARNVRLPIVEVVPSWCLHPRPVQKNPSPEKFPILSSRLPSPLSNPASGPAAAPSPPEPRPCQVSCKWSETNTPTTPEPWRRPPTISSWTSRSTTTPEPWRRRPVISSSPPQTPCLRFPTGDYKEEKSQQASTKISSIAHYLSAYSRTTS